MTYYSKLTELDELSADINKTITAAKAAVQLAFNAEVAASNLVTKYGKDIPDLDNESFIPFINDLGLYDDSKLKELALLRARKIKNGERKNFIRLNRYINTFFVVSFNHELYNEWGYEYEGWDSLSFHEIIQFIAAIESGEYDVVDWNI